MSSSERARHKFRSVSGLEGYIYTGAGPARVAVVEDVSARFRSVKVPGRRDRRSYARDIFVDVKHHLSRKTLHAFILFSSYGGASFNHCASQERICRRGQRGFTADVQRGGMGRMIISSEDCQIPEKKASPANYPGRAKQIRPKWTGEHHTKSYQ